MIRRLITAFAHLILRIFYQRIEIAGLEHVPHDKPVIFVLNHPNGLVDPLFILCFAPRPVSLLGKSTLFKMPVVGWLARGIDTLPVYRHQDKGEDPKRNQETFQKCRELLERGGSLALFPEGVSHSEPSLRPLKTGAARIALGAASAGMKNALQIVPVGLYYTAKGTFRSHALLYFGAPIQVEPTPLDENFEPARTAAVALSNQLEAALREVTLNADTQQALATVHCAEEIFTADEKSEPSLANELELKKRFIEGYEFYRTNAPEKLAAIESRIRQYAEQLALVGLKPRDFSSAAQATPGRMLRRALQLILPAPLALFGIIFHYPAYRLAGLLARKLSRNDDDVVSTIKVLAAALLFPLTWLILGGVTWWYWSVPSAVVGLILLPLCGYLAIHYAERFEASRGAFKAMLFFITKRYFVQRMLAEKNFIRAEIVALGKNQPS